MSYSKPLHVPELNELSREVGAGEFLFRKNDIGTTMFIILQGSVGLYDDIDSHPEAQLIRTMGWGQIFGEQAIVGQAPYHRKFSAKTLAKTRLLEFDAEGMRTIEKRIPDFTFRILQITAVWLSRVNEMLQVLEPLEEGERLRRAIEFLSRQSGSISPEGHDIWLTSNYLAYVAKIAPERVEHYLEHLTKRGALVAVGPGFQVHNPGIVRSEIASFPG